MRTLLVAGAVGVAGALGAGAVVASQYWVPAGRALPGTAVGGHYLPSGEGIDAFLARRAKAVAAREAYLTIDGDVIAVTFADLGVGLDAVTTRDRAVDAGATGHPGARLHRAYRARQGDLAVAPAYQLDRSRLRRRLARLAETVAREPSDARLDLKNHRVIDERPGRELDIAATVAAVAEGKRHDGAFFPIKTREVAPRVTGEMLTTVDVTQVVSTFETTVKGYAGNRGRNVLRAAEYLNGTVLPPGGVLSFNETVGPRRLDRGFKFAPVILDDELVPGVGGGVCQVASTLHGAAVYGGLEVVRRRSHSRPSSYTRLGLDAMVLDGEVDLQIRNPYPAPLIVHAFSPAPRKLRVEFLGRPPPTNVRYRYAVSNRKPFYRRVRVKAWLGDRLRKRQRGRPGYDVISVVDLIHDDGTEERRTYRSHYRPTPEVFWIGPDVDPEELPPLPEGAEPSATEGPRVAGGSESGDRG